MKKAFTFIELAIVLVIIGLIMGMSLKGRDIIASAEMRKEVNKLRKYEQAFGVNFLKKGSPMPVAWEGSDTQFSDNLTDRFIELGLLTEEDMTLRYVTNRIYFIPNIDEDAGTGGYDLGSRPAANATVFFNIGVHMQNGYETFLCNVEGLLDDREVVQGFGRVLKGGNTINFNIGGDEERAYADCSALTGAANREYIYVFFQM